MAIRRFDVRSNGFAKIGAELEQRLHDVAYAAATNIAERAAVSMEGPKHGRRYRRHNVTHQASAPREAPAIDTGILHGSMFVREVGPAAFIVGTNVEYAPHLEIGTVNMAARPFLVPAVEQERTAFVQAITAAVEGAR